VNYVVGIYTPYFLPLFFAAFVTITAAYKYFAQKPIKHNQEVLETKGFKEAHRTFFEEFRDSHTTIDHIVAEGD
jgi:hypothetical protein